MAPDDVLNYWFGDWDDNAPLSDDDPQIRRWWNRDAALHLELQTKFGPLHEACARGEFREWAATARGLLARVIVLDQLSRAVHRDSGRAFKHDAEARELTARALEQAWDRELRPIERSFLYLPLMHAEDRAAHRRALSLYTGLAEEVEEAGLTRADYYRQTVVQALRHKEIIDRFGRYPQRNFPMERTSTPEELAFLEGQNLYQRPLT